MAPYNSELVKRNREILANQEREKVYNKFDHFLSDIKSNFQELYNKGFNSREEFLKFMDSTLLLKHTNGRIPEEEVEERTRVLLCNQVFYKIDKGEGNFKIKQLVSFSRRDLDYFSNTELEEVRSDISTYLQDPEALTEEDVFNVLEREEGNLLGYHIGPNFNIGYYTLLEADLPRINGGYIEYFNAVKEEENDSSEDTQYH